MLMQNRVGQANANLPAAVKQYGINTKKALALPVLVYTLTSPNGTWDNTFLTNYANINIQDKLSRVKGVGEVRAMGGTDYSMRVWVKPDRLMTLGLTVSDLMGAISAQNDITPAGQLGGPPAPKGTSFTYTVKTKGRLNAPSVGDLATAVRASMCVPGLFSPVMMENQQHVDGMLVQNLPVEVGRTLSADGVVVAVEVGSNLEAVLQNSIIGIAFRSLDVSVEERTDISRKAADLLLRPRTEKIPHLNFHQFVQMAIKEGRRSFDDQLDALEDRVYGPWILEPVREIPLVISAPEPLRTRLFSMAEATIPKGVRAVRHYVRLLRRIHAAGVAKHVEIRFSPDGPILQASPHPDLRMVKVDASDEWKGLASRVLEDAGVKERASFNPVALGRALDDFFIHALFRGRPLLRAHETKFDSTSGILTVSIREESPGKIRIADRILSEGQTAYLRNLLRPLEGQPFDATIFTKSLLLAEKRLGLAELHLGADPGGSRLALLATPIPDDRITVDAALAFESTWQAQGAANLRANRLLGSDLNFSFSVNTNRLWDSATVHFIHAFGRWPRLGFRRTLRERRALQLRQELGGVVLDAEEAQGGADLVEGTLRKLTSRDALQKFSRAEIRELRAYFGRIPIWSVFHAEEVNLAIHSAWVCHQITRLQFM